MLYLNYQSGINYATDMLAQLVSSPMV